MDIGGENDQMDLPPGFRFHPTDEELISQYLYKKVLDGSFCATAIGEADLNKSEPWELPWKAKMGEKEWYFFCVRDKKYPTGLRTNRATDSGYWKATGKDKEIYREKSLVGMKKTLVFYKGRAPKGEKSNWVMHEYRLDGIFSIHNLPKTAKNEWVICRVFEKNSSGNRTHISGLVSINSSAFPPLMETSSYRNINNKPISELAYVSCFSNPSSSINNPVSSSDISSFYAAQSLPLTSNFQFSNSDDVMQEQSMILRALVRQQQHDYRTVCVSDEITVPSTSVEPMDLDCFWHY